MVTRRWREIVATIVFVLSVITLGYWTATDTGADNRRSSQRSVSPATTPDEVILTPDEVIECLII